MGTGLFGWIQFCSVALSTGGGLSPITSTQPAAPTLGSMAFLEPRAGEQLRVRRPGTRRPHRGPGSCATPPARLLYRLGCGERTARDCRMSIQYSKARVIERNTIHGTSDPGARPSELSKLLYPMSVGVLACAESLINVRDWGQITQPQQPLHPLFFPSARGGIASVHCCWCCVFLGIPTTPCS